MRPCRHSPRAIKRISSQASLCSRWPRASSTPSIRTVVSEGPKRQSRAHLLGTNPSVNCSRCAVTGRLLEDYLRGDFVRDLASLLCSRDSRRWRSCRRQYGATELDVCFYRPKRNALSLRKRRPATSTGTILIARGAVASQNPVVSCDTVTHAADHPKQIRRGWVRPCTSRNIRPRCGMAVCATNPYSVRWRSNSAWTAQRTFRVPDERH